MKKLLFFPLYVGWHYRQGTKDYIENAKRLLLFVFQYFSINVLLRTLFVPWKRLSESYKSNSNPEDLLGTFITNFLMRIVGAGIRIVVIFFGLLSVCLSFLATIFGFLVWIFLPVVFAFLVAVGLNTLLS
jgi:hypothetical protein